MRTVPQGQVNKVPTIRATRLRTKAHKEAIDAFQPRSTRMLPGGAEDSCWGRAERAEILAHARGRVAAYPDLLRWACYRWIITTNSSIARPAANDGSMRRVRSATTNATT
jgi:hypothetical protein